MCCSLCLLFFVALGVVCAVQSGSSKLFAWPAGLCSLKGMEFQNHSKIFANISYSHSKGFCKPPLLLTILAKVPPASSSR